MDHTARWRQLVTGAESELPLDEAALLIAAHDRPDLDVTAGLGRLDDLAGAVSSRGPGAAHVDDVTELLFHRLGIAGNSRDYDDPRNSYLDLVVQRGLGIPISMSVLLIEVGRRAGVNLVGVGLPGHYVVRDPNRPNTLIDAFGGGRRLDEGDCRRLLSPHLGDLASFHPAAFEASGPLSTLARMLANLDRSFRRRQDVAGLTWATRLRVAIPGQPVSMLVEAAGTLTELGRYDEAAALLEQVAQRAELPPEAASRVRARAVGARARLN
jgi:regulator of sirC expression with transglutaminase-like and TPR domain